MPLDAHSEKLLMRYLSDQLSADERDAVNQRLAADSSYFAALEELETEFVDRLALGELSEADATAFRNYLTESGQEHRLAIASALHRKATAAIVAPPGRAHALPQPVPQRPATVPQTPWLRYGAIAALLALAALLLWQPPGQTPTNPAPSNTRSAVAPIAITLPASVVRGDAVIPSFRIPSTATELRLRLEIPEGRIFPAYRAVVLASGDQRLWDRTGPIASAEAGVFEATIPIDILTNPSRELLLYGIPSTGDEVMLATYSFRITTVDAP